MVVNRGGSRILDKGSATCVNRKPPWNLDEFVVNRSRYRVDDGEIIRRSRYRVVDDGEIVNEPVDAGRQGLYLRVIINIDYI